MHGSGTPSTTEEEYNRRKVLSLAWHNVVRINKIDIEVRVSPVGPAHCGFRVEIPDCTDFQVNALLKPEFRDSESHFGIALSLVGTDVCQNPAIVYRELIAKERASVLRVSIFHSYERAIPTDLAYYLVTGIPDSYAIGIHYFQCQVGYAVRSIENVLVCLYLESRRSPVCLEYGC